eukprot:scaffold1112_cov116-Isochrysis_galbana.AAC.40
MGRPWDSPPFPRLSSRGVPGENGRCRDGAVSREAAAAIAGRDSVPVEQNPGCPAGSCAGPCGPAQGPKDPALRRTVLDEGSDQTAQRPKMLHTKSNQPKQKSTATLPWLCVPA